MNVYCVFERYRDHECDCKTLKGIFSTREAAWATTTRLEMLAKPEIDALPASFLLEFNVETLVMDVLYV